MKWCTRIVLAGTLLVVAGGMAQAAATKPTLSPKLTADLRHVRQAYTRLQKHVQTHPAIRHDAYLVLGLHLVQRFVGQIQAGVPSKNCPSPQWAKMQINELGYVLRQTKLRLAALEHHVAQPYAFSKPQPPVVSKGGMLWTTGGDHKRPVFLYGYGHFGQVAKDMPNFHNLGISMAQQVLGPSSMTPQGKFTAGGRQFLKVFPRAARGGVMVDLLLSPQYYPAWAYHKDPSILFHIPKWGVTELDHSNPLYRSVIHDWIHLIIPAIRHQPAAISVCLENEPWYLAGVGRSHAAWVSYLKHKHGTIAALNALYHSHYKSFSKVPVPGHINFSGVTPQRKFNAHFYDWVRFDQHQEAQWFGWMNRQVKHLDPHLLTDVKIRYTIFNRKVVTYGIDPEMICGVTDMAGNDDWAWATPGGKWGWQWRHEEMWYDLLNSFRDQPVFNSENHIIPDNSPPKSIPPAATRAAMWQGALHHLAASTIWVWQSLAPPADLHGCIYFRPANIYAVGRAALDANRLAPQLVRINQAPAHVAILYSFPSIFWNPHYPQAVAATYTALNFTGHKVTFISERQLATDHLSPANRHVKWIVLAGATHVTNSEVKGLQRFVTNGGHVIALGPHPLAYDQYGRAQKLPSTLAHIRQLHAAAKPRILADRLNAWLSAGGLATTSLQMPHQHQLAWGVEYRVVKTSHGVLIPMMNMKNQAQTVRLNVSAPCRDLISGRKIDPKSIHLAPMQPLLLLCHGVR